MTHRSLSAEFIPFCFFHKWLCGWHATKGDRQDQIKLKSLPGNQKIESEVIQAT